MSTSTLEDLQDALGEFEKAHAAGTMATDEFHLLALAMMREAVTVIRHGVEHKEIDDSHKQELLEIVKRLGEALGEKSLAEGQPQ